MRKKTLTTIAAVSVLGAVVIGLGAVSSWFTNWNTKTWFGRGGNSTVQSDKPIIDTNESKDGAIISDSVNNGITLLSAKLPVAAYAANGVSEQADTAYTLTAKINPPETTNTAVDWTVSWVDSDSDFANGKAVTDYITVIASNDGSLSAVVECKQAFGAQITVICTVRENTELFATCTVDYVKKIQKAKIGWSYYYGGPSDYFSEDKITAFFTAGCDNATGYFIREINTTIGTLSDNYECTLELSAAHEFIELLHYGTAGSKSISIDSDYAYGVSTHGYLFDLALMEKLFGMGVFRSAGFYNLLGEDNIKNTYGCVVAKVTFTGEYSSYSYTSRITFLQSGIEVAANDVTLDTPSIIF